MPVEALFARPPDAAARLRLPPAPSESNSPDDALLLNPWDREIYTDGAFQFHPEYVGALAEQGILPDPSLLIGAEAVKAAKST